MSYRRYSAALTLKTANEWHKWRRPPSRTVQVCRFIYISITPLTIIPLAVNNIPPAPQTITETFLRWNKLRILLWYSSLQRLPRCVFLDNAIYTVFISWNREYLAWTYKKLTRGRMGQWDITRQPRSPLLGQPFGLSLPFKVSISLERTQAFGCVLAGHICFSGSISKTSLKDVVLRISLRSDTHITSADGTFLRHLWPTSPLYAIPLVLGQALDARYELRVLYESCSGRQRMKQLRLVRSCQNLKAIEPRPWLNLSNCNESIPISKSINITVWMNLYQSESSESTSIGASLSPYS